MAAFLKLAFYKRLFFLCVTGRSGSGFLLVTLAHFRVLAGQAIPQAENAPPKTLGPFLCLTRPASLLAGPKVASGSAVTFHHRKPFDSHRFGCVLELGNGIANKSA